MKQSDQIEKMIAVFRSGDKKAFLKLAYRTIEDAELSVMMLAKIHSWIAQARVDLGEYKASLLEYDKALEYAHEAQDYDGIVELKQQIEEVQAQADAVAKIDGRSKSSIAMGVNLLQSGKKSQAEHTLLSAVADADEMGSTRSKVLSRLALSRFPQYRQQMLSEAYEIALEADDMNLIVAVKKTMEQFDMLPPSKVF